MQAILFEAPGQVTLRDVPDPSPPPGWARIRVHAAAICRTDFDVLSGTIAAVYPLTPGHEWSGVVDRVGSSGGERWLGRRVTGDNEVGCLVCPYCRRGEWRRCPEYRQIGFALPGAYAEYLLAPVSQLHELGADVSFEQGAILEPLGVGLAVARMAETHVGTTAVILGAGPIGLSCLAALKASGAARILVLERRAARATLARQWGARAVFESSSELASAAGALHPEGTDLVVDATGDPALLDFGAGLARFGGTFVLAGYFGGAGACWRPDAVHERNVRVLGAGNNAGFTGAAARAAADGILRTETMITHRYRLEEYAAALSLQSLAAESYIKGVFLFP